MAEKVIDLIRCLEISDRVLTGSRACACCQVAAVSSASRMAQLVLDAISEMLSNPWNATLSPEWGGDAGMYVDPNTSLVALQPGRVTVSDPVIRAIPAGAATGALALGMVLLATAQEMEAVSRLELQTSSLGLVSRFVPKLVARAVRYSQERCGDCVYLNLLSQSSIPRTVTIHRRTRRP